MESDLRKITNVGSTKALGEVRLVAPILALILLLALLLRVGVAFAWTNIHAVDEVFQTLEPAHRLTYGNGIVTWEFREGIRSWVLPGILAGVMRISAWMGEGSRGYLAGITIFLCLLSLSAVLVAFLWGYRTAGLVAAILSAGACSIWFELVYFAPKALTEVVAAHLLLPGVYLGDRGRCFQPRTRLFLAGIFCGFALSLRIQLAATVLFAVGCICRKDLRGKWVPMAAGILAPILAFGLLDAFTWSYPFQSFWMNVWINIGKGKSLEYGVSPWYTYLLVLKNVWTIWGLVPIMLLALVGARRSPILFGLVFMIVLSHSLIAHKEYRFIYPALPMVVMLVGLGTAELVTVLQARSSSQRLMVAAVSVCLVLLTSTSFILAVQFDNTKIFNFTGGGDKTSNWTRFSDSVIAFQKLNAEKTLCGVGLSWKQLFFLGGYTYLHRDVPIFLIGPDNDFERLTPGFNYFVERGRVPLPPPKTYALQACSKTTCLYKRPGSCTKITGYHINQVLKQWGY